MTFIIHPYSRTIGQALEAAASDAPDRPAIITSDVTLTYAQLLLRARRAAALLARFGLRRGDRVAAMLPNDLPIIEAFLGSQLLGAVWVGLNPRLPSNEAARLLTASGAKLALTVAEAAAPHPAAALQLDHLTWANLINSSAPSVLSDPDPAAAAILSYTSGTTGEPKGVVHSQHNMMLATAAFAGVATRPGERIGVSLPLAITNVMITGVVNAIVARASCSLLDRFDALSVARAVKLQRLEQVRTLLPTTLYDLIHHPDVKPGDLGSLRFVATGAADCPEQTRTDFEDRFGIRVVGSYGLTEAPTVVTYEHHQEPRIVGSSGAALPHVQVDIRDEIGASLLPGAEGEIWVGPAPDGPYAGAYRPMLRAQGAASSVDPAPRGWLRTGDLGRLDSAGRLFVTARKSDVINRGGATVHAAEIERAIAGLPSVEGCAVVGRPDARLGQRIIAYVEGTRARPHEVAAHCRRELVAYKLPDEVVVVSRLPRNPMGKVIKRELT